jgi:hypothetical protein
MKQVKYEVIEFEDDETEFLIGSVLLHEGKVCNATIEEAGSLCEFKKVEEFVNEVKKMNWIRD